MPTSPLAGKPAPKDLLIYPAKLEREYFDRRPDPGDPTQRVAFGFQCQFDCPADIADSRHVNNVFTLADHAQTAFLMGP